ncbi:MAG: RraA family protein [Thermomicrobiales bacterium]|nr:RraA family protein [Thermomicrobiales bacterium]
MTEFEPPAATLSAEALEFLRSVDSPTIANAIELVSARERAEGYIGGKIRSMVPATGAMVGQALTVKVSNPRGPVVGKEGFYTMWDALAKMPSPSVIVMQDISGEPSRCAYAGEVMTTLAMRLGAVGMVTDGGYRDLAEVEALGFHYYAQYAVVAHGNFAIHEVGDPVFMDGEWINTGDILHGDANGIVVVPSDTLAGLPDAVASIRDRERRVMEFIRGDAFTLEGFKSGKGY